MRVRYAAEEEESLLLEGAFLCFATATDPNTHRMDGKAARAREICP